ncbi:MAG: ARMT1-like domain-containing protein [Candidatus Brocadiia bacterium]
MKTYLECIPCFVRQALEAVTMATGDEELRERLMRRVLSELSEFPFDESPPVMGRRIHEIVREATGHQDPYAEAKRRSNELALELFPALRREVEAASDPFEASVRLAIAANVIDLGAKAERELGKDVVRAELEAALHEPLDPAGLGELRQAGEGARDVLYLADNAGEIVFDRLLIEHLPAGRVTVAVRGGPIINDATLEDARRAGVEEVAEVITNGTASPGTPLDDCSAEFRGRFAAADVIIAKGQGNYETLSDAEANVFFLLRVKCPVLARDTGREAGRSVIITPGERAMGAQSPAQNGSPKRRR